MIAVVTGGCKGLGEALTKSLANKGYKVYALYQTSEQNAKEMEKADSNISVEKVDIRKEEEVKSFFGKIELIDLLINNASIARDNSLEEKTKEEFMEVLETNVVGTYLVTKYALSKLKEKGTIINISSNNALDNYNPISMDYDASKAGINLLTKDFSLLLKQKVIAICPGWIETEEIKLANPKFIQEEMIKSGQKELLNKEELAEKIIELSALVETGSIIEMKEVNTWKIV